ncbi:MAG TPA: ABC transporter ATP-binding protein [Pyrodictiaceae archaeon]|nr:ABC transporter ATP-binding protein [Pyrodictiaceae archaeon]
MKQPLVILDNVWKVYRLGYARVFAIRGVSLELYESEFTAVVGPSGSGKSTLLHLVGGLDKPTRGRVLVDGVEISGLDEKGLAEYRRRYVGFVFQQFYLIPRLTALENVEIALMARGVPQSERRRRALELLEVVGLRDRAYHRPGELSGGEQQRVAIARALANNPKLLLADEPTGNLDSATAHSIMKLFRRLVDEQGVTIIMVTHNLELVSYCDRVVKLRDGVVVGDEKVPRSQ